MAEEFKISLETYDVAGQSMSNYINDGVNAGKTMRVTVSEWVKDRSIPANAQQHVWYKQIGEFTSTDTKTVAAECKIDFGLPILLSDPEVAPILGHALRGFDRMTRSQQIKFMAVIQVTSIMNSKQHTQYRDAILNYYNLQGLNIDYRQK